MLWLNTTTGDVMDTPKRPSNEWVIIVDVTIDNNTVESTLEGLRRVIINSDTNAISINDMEWEGKTGLNLYDNELVWKDTIDTAGFPYLKLTIASDGTLEIRYDEDAKDSTKDAIRTNTTTDDDTPLKRGGRGGGGEGGEIPGEPSEIPGEEPSEPPEETPDEVPGLTPEEEKRQKEEREEQEERDAYEEGKEKADEIYRRY